MSENFTFFGMAVTKNVGNDWWEWVQTGDCYPSSVNYMTHNFWIHCPPPLKIGNEKLKTEAPTPMSTVVISLQRLQQLPHHLHTDGWTGCLVYVYQWVPVGPKKGGILIHVQNRLTSETLCLLNGPGRKRETLTDSICFSYQEWTNL